MASTDTFVEGIGNIRIYRRKGLRNIRVTVEQDGRVRLSIPWYVSRSAGIRYLLSKKDWVNKNQQGRDFGWKDGQRLTDEFTLRVDYSEGKARSRAVESLFVVSLPQSTEEPERQKLLDKHITEFLREQCREKVLPRLFEAARVNGFKVKEVKIKKLKSRWGSCTHEKVISLNLSLARLPSELSDYVIYHELAHTKHLHHGKDFWQEVEKHVPDYKNRRKDLRKFNPSANS